MAGIRSRSIQSSVAAATGGGRALSVREVFELVDPDPRTLARALSSAVVTVRTG